MTGPDRREIAARLRALVLAPGGEAGDGGGSVTDVASRLGVDEAALRKAIDEMLPEPTMDVMVAVVRDLGVDPTWLLTGEYAPATHQRALESDGAGIASLLKELVRRDSPATGLPIADGGFTPDFTAETRIDP